MVKVKNVLIFWTIITNFYCVGSAVAADPRPYFSWPEEKRSSAETITRHRKERRQYIEDRPELSQRKKNLIELGMPEPGFTKEEVLAAIRNPEKPDKIETGHFKNGADELWFYRGVTWNDYFYFQDGVLIAQEKYRVKRLDP